MTPMDIIQAVQNGIDPNWLVMQLAQQNPAIKQALHAINGKTPDEIERMAVRMAKEQGVNLNKLIQQMGIGPIKR